MYSYEERVRAVELYLKLGKRIKATIRQLGYPTKDSLKAWCDEFEKSGDLQKGYVRVKPKYSEAAVYELCTREESAQAVVRKLDVARDAEVRRTLAEIFGDNHRSYGYRRVQAALSRQRVFLSEKSCVAS
jgi:transposase-like protein